MGRNNEPNKRAHHYCNELDPRTSASCDGVFTKVDIFLANELCFEIVGPTVPIPVRDVDLYTSRKILLNVN